MVETHHPLGDIMASSAFDTDPEEWPEHSIGNCALVDY